MEICILDAKRRKDLNLPNQPFELFGRMIPSCQDGVWRYTEQLLDEGERSEMCFPDEDYDFDALSVDCTFLGAYENGECIGLAILQETGFRYWYLYDLKVNRDRRRSGVGRALIERACALARERGYLGIRTVAQDNNLAACRFYLKNGFEIGGFDNRGYRGTRQADKADIYFYLDV